MAIVDELVTVLGVKVAAGAEGAMGRFKASIDGIANTAKQFGVIASVAVAGVAVMVKGAIDQAAELDNISRKTGLSTTALQEWGYAAATVGADAKGVYADLEKLSKGFGLARRGSEQRLMNIADRMQGKSDFQAQRIGSFYGLSEDTIKLLQRGREGVIALREEAQKMGVITPEATIKRAAQLKKNISELTFVFRSFTQSLALSAVPAIEKVTKGLRAWLRENQALVAQKMEGFVLGVTNALERLWNIITRLQDIFAPLTGAIADWLPEMTDAELVSHLLTGALGGLLVLLSPLLIKFTLLGAAILYAATWIEDFIVYMEGGESVIGDFFNAFEERWPNLSAALKSLATLIGTVLVGAFEKIKGVAEDVWGSIKENILMVLDSLDAAFASTGASIEGFEAKFPKLMSFLKDLAVFLSDVLVKALDLVADSLSKMFVLIGPVIEGLAKIVEKGMEAGEWLLNKLSDGESAYNMSEALSGAPPTPDFFSQVVPGANTSKNNIYNDNKQIEIKFDTTDPMMAALATADYINNATINTPGNFAPMVM